MSLLHPARYAFGLVAAAAILTGCGGSQSSAGAALPQNASGLAPATLKLRTTTRAAAGSTQGIYSFLGSPDGQEPLSAVVESRMNHHYPRVIGATLLGGNSNNDGTVFGLTPGKNGALKESILYTFKGYPTDGSEPTGIIREIDRASPIFYVTANGGGVNNEGAVVLTEPGQDPNHDWDSTLLYSFAGTPDGANPFGPVIEDKSGNLYGTTSGGGTDGAGAVYRMARKGSSYSETVLYSFKSGKDGDQPYAGLIIDKKGALYGTTVEGGSVGYGSVFKLAQSSSGYTKSILYSFQGVPDGSQPYSGVCADPHGDLYGTTQEGGTQNLGTVYKLTPSGSNYKESVLWSFGSVAGDGATPYGGVIVTKKGVIYGTTYDGGSGGSSGLGTFFTLTPSGSGYKESVSSFTGANGANPYAGPLLASDGIVFVTTAAGGTQNKGTAGRAGSSPSVSECF